MPVSSQTLALTAGAVVVAAAAIGSIPFGYVLERRALRRDLRRLGSPGQESPGQLEMQLRALVAGTAADPDAAPPPRGTDLAAAVLDTAKVLLAATLAWHVMLQVAPGRGHFGHTESGIAFTANQVIAFWQSAGLWAGAAAITTHFAPLGVHRRGGQGQAPALGLAFIYCPIGFSVGVAAFFAALALTRDVTRSVLVALPAFVAYAWLGWAFDWRASWGVTNGPELTLWAAVVAGVAAAAAIAQTRRAAH